MWRKLLGFLFVLLVWEAYADYLHNPAFIAPSRVAPALARMILSGEAFLNAQSTLIIVCIGFSFAAVMGIIAGVLVTQSETINAIISPVVDSIRPVAALTLFPLLIVLLGLGIKSKAFIIFWTAWPAIMLNTAQGIRKVSHDVTEAAQLDGAGKWPVLRFISFPLAIPMVMTGLRIGMSGGWISVVAAEMLGGTSGLGYSVLSYSQSFRFPEMYASIILIAMLGLTMNLTLAWLQRKLDYEEISNESPFERFNDRAISFGLDSIRLRGKPKDPEPIPTNSGPD